MTAVIGPPLSSQTPDAPGVAGRPETPAAALAEAGFEELVETAPPGLLRRVFTTQRHLVGLAGGGLLDWVRRRPAAARRGLRFRAAQLLALAARPFVKRSLATLPFPVQLRRRLEMLGPTYIKLGQILSLRADLLPPSITDELQNLLDRLPAVSPARFAELVVADLGRPIEAMFSWLDPHPTGSASIAQSHRATTLAGDAVILKVVKPGIAEILERDARLLNVLGRVLQLFLSRYQPRRVIREFTEYTLKEVDLRREADNAETFGANFRDLPGVVFPRIYRELSGRRVLCMQYLDGMRPDSAAARRLSAEGKDRIIELGAAAIIRMLYQDGFFHADLHPGNLLILPGPQAGFIDLGMVGRLEEDTRRTLLYYYYCLVMGDAENAARYLTSVAEAGPGGDPEGFRRAVVEVSQRWARAASFADFSLAQLILESVALGGHYRMYFPVELVLMVKALVTFEGVGHLMKPGFDVAEVSKAPIQRIFLRQFSPLRIARESLRGAPELVDAVIKAPLLIIEGLRLLEQSTRRPSENPFAGVRGTIFGGFCLVAGAVIAAAGGPWPLWTVFFSVGIFAALGKSR